MAKDTINAGILDAVHDLHTDTIKHIIKSVESAEYEMTGIFCPVETISSAAL